MKLRIPATSYTVSVIGGMIIGVIFGDRVFREVEAAFGDPLTDIFFGLMGGLLAALIYEIIAHCRGSF